MSKNKQKQAKIIKNEPIVSVNSEPKKAVSTSSFSLPSIPQRFQWLVLVGAIALISFFVFYKYLTFKNAYLFKDIGSDSINFFYPYAVLVSEFIHQGMLPSWSFKFGMGQNTLPYYTDPFTTLHSFFSKDQIPYAFVYVEILKIFVAGLSFYGYLKTLFNNNNYVALLGGLMFAFCGYMILGGSGWYIVSTEAAITAFILYAFEKFLKENRWYLFPIAIALLASFQPFLLYTHTLFLLLYSIFRLSYESDGWNWRKASNFYLKLVGLGALGIGIGAIGLSTMLWQMIQSPRVSGGVGYFSKLSSGPILGLGAEIQYVSLLMRTFSSDLIGAGSNYKGWQNYLEAPITYVGIINFLLFPQIFTSTTGWKKKLFIIMAVALALPLIFPFFRYMFWGFAGDYYRSFGFFVGIIFLFIGMNSLKNIEETKKINLIVLGISLVVTFILLFTDFGGSNNVIEKSTRTFIAFMLFFYAVLLALIKLDNFHKLAKIVLFLGVCGELIYLSKITTNKRDTPSKSELNDKVSYNDYTVDAINYIKTIDKTPFYRVEKSYASGNSIHGSINDAMIQGYNGTSSYGSFNQGNYIAFLRGLGIIAGKPEDMETLTRWSSGLKNAGLFQAFASIKYYLRNDTISHNSLLGFVKINQFSNVTIFENKNFLPLGFSYNQYITKENFSKLSMDNRAKVLYKACIIGTDEISKFPNLKPYDLKDSSNVFTIVEYQTNIQNLKKDTLNISYFSDTNIKGSVDFEEDKMLLLTIPHDKGWQCMVDGKPTKIDLIDFGISGLYLNKGKHSVEFQYVRPFFKESLMVSGVSLLLFLGLIGWGVLRKNKVSNEVK